MSERFITSLVRKVSETYNGISGWYRGYSTFASHEVTNGLNGIYWTGRANFLEQKENYEFVIGVQYALGDTEALIGGGLTVVALRSRNRIFKTVGLLIGLGLGCTGIKHIRDASRADDMLQQELTKPT